MKLNKYTNSILLLILMLSISACQKDSYEQKLEYKFISALESSSRTHKVDYYLLPESNDYNNIPQDAKNPLTADKVALGKMLFYETALAINPKNTASKGTYSCATCHVPASGFQAGLKQGISEGGLGIGQKGEGRYQNPSYLESELDVQDLRTPTILNIAYTKTTLWSGKLGAVGLNENTQNLWTIGEPTEINFLGYEGVETQAIVGLDVHRLGIDSFLLTNPYYQEMFNKVFSNFPITQRVTFETMGLALAAYERTVLANKSPFQQWLKEIPNALTTEQLNGGILFFGKANCYQCHDGPSLSSENFYALGLNDLEESDRLGVFPNFEQTRKGRGGFTKDANDDYKFKTPQIYGLNEMSFFGHGSSFSNIQDLIEYKNTAKQENSLVPTTQLASEFIPLGLSSDEIAQLSEFVLGALSDKELNRYVPTFIESNYCFPNNDVVSKEEMGCE